MIQNETGKTNVNKVAVVWHFKDVLWKKYEQLVSYLLTQFREMKLNSDWTDTQLVIVNFILKTWTRL